MTTWTKRMSDALSTAFFRLSGIEPRNLKDATTIRRWTTRISKACDYLTAREKR